MWMSIVIFKNCTQTPKSEKFSGKVREKSGNFEKLKCWPPWTDFSGHTVDDIKIFSTNHSNCLFPVNYPSYLNLTKNILTNNSVNFLDLKIVHNNNQLCIDMHDKCKDFDFKVNTFKNFCSCMHLSVCRNNLLNHLFHIKIYAQQNLNLII